jgi:hypothetical protein
MNARLPSTCPPLLCTAVVLAGLTALPAPCLADAPPAEDVAPLRPIEITRPAAPPDLPPKPPEEPSRVHRLGYVVSGGILLGLALAGGATAIGLATIRFDGDWGYGAQNIALLIGTFSFVHAVPGAVLIYQGYQKPSTSPVSLSARPLWASAPRGATSPAGLALSGTF